MTIPRSTVEGMIEMLSAWVRAFPHEETYAAREYGVPSIFARMDGIIDEKGSFYPYEIQEGCGWVGYTGIINQRFREMRDELAAKVWPRFPLLIPSARNHDDELWLSKISLEEAQKSDGPLMVRLSILHGVDPDIRLPIIARSMKPYVLHGDKRYGITLGLWRSVDDPAESGVELPWDSSFVLKPLRAHGSRDVMVWNHEAREGRATRTQITRTLAERKRMILQPFVPPTRIEIEGNHYNAILRPFFGYHPRERRWVPMHGVWTARPAPALRIHGASDAISGPLMLEG